LKRIEQAVERDRLHAAGFISYEAAPAFDYALKTLTPDTDFPLLWFGLYDAPEELTENDFSAAGKFSLSEWQPSVSRENYDQAIIEIRERIARGETYQVNHTFRLRADFSGDAFSLFRKMAQAQQAEYAAYLDLGRFAVCSASPELFFRMDGRALLARPMKGTAGRGLTLAEDQAQARWLAGSCKNRAENIMIIDMIRNDLGRVADIGSVRVCNLCKVTRFPSVWQMTSDVHAASNKSFTEILTALFPCASITGAPKVSTMNIIQQLEEAPRKIYTGAIGYYSPGRKACFSVAIRTALVDREKKLVEYGVGGGIVWDSTPGEEYEECRIKAAVVMRERPVFDLLETILWEDVSGFYLLEKHLKRMRDSAEYFNYIFDREKIAAALARHAEHLPPGAHKVRLLLNLRGDFKVESSPLPAATDEPVQVKFARKPVSSKDVFLYHKTTHREVYETAFSEKGNCGDVLLFNERGEITESCIANVVVELDGRRYTPPVECGLLGGVFRNHLLENGEVRERVIRREEIGAQTPLWLVNSVRKWRRVFLFRQLSD
jgi:para-aminobenzoate synthetase/4-amino-4-deoxychorismate lyase